jgi:tetratricopeptide (TPR) repeat protein
MKSHIVASLRPLHGIALFLFLPALLLAQNSDLGQIDFPTSGSALAQKYFIKGVLLLHSFEYEDAADEFRQAQKIEPNFAMAYWGEAMTHNHPLWMQVNVEKARAVLNRLAPTPEARLAKAPTGREKGYLGTIETLYGEGDKKARDLAYAEAMRRLTDQFPEDLEAAAFYSLSLLGTCHNGRDFATHMKAAAIAEKAFQKNPRHPGAVHYLIHSYDDPIHAPLGLPMAQTYAKIAPAAAHALHMPSHIFFALGMWDEAAASNEESWAASEARRQRKNLSIPERGYHSLLWREYAYLQQGRFREAKAMLDIMAEDARQSEAGRIRYHLAAMRAAYVIDTQAWDSEAARLQTNTAGLEKDLIAGDLFARGLCAAKTGELARAEKLLHEIETLAPSALVNTEAAKTGETMQCHTLPNETTAYSPEVQAARIMALQLKALLHMKHDKTTEAVQLMKEAAAAEDRLTFEFGPPEVVKPAHELLGETLFALARFQEAQTEYELALKRTPNRLLSLVGLKRAASKAGDQIKAEETQATLRKILHRADAELAELAQMD